MAVIRWTAEAERWLRDIRDYISQDNPSAAQKVVEDIYEYIQKLQMAPEIGYKYRDDIDGEIRVLLYGHYRIAYLLREPDFVEILGIFHGALDIKRYLH